MFIQLYTLVVVTTYEYTLYYFTLNFWLAVGIYTVENKGDDQKQYV